MINHSTTRPFKMPQILSNAKQLNFIVLCPSLSTHKKDIRDISSSLEIDSGELVNVT
jgi:hypothetical protein